jgi:hypothetical protein
MKPLLHEVHPTLGLLTALVASAERHQSSPFAKRHVQSRLNRALESARGGASRRRLRPALSIVAGVCVAASAAAAGYSLLAADSSLSDETADPVAPVAAAPPLSDESRSAPSKALDIVSPVQPSPEAAPPAAGQPNVKRADKPRAGEDPAQVAEAVRALRKQGDAARAQTLLDQYLRANPHGALAEDALALSIEAAAARKDPRASDYARRYLARYPNGRFRGVAERALSR